MTPQEAIETIKIAQAEVEWNYPMDYAAAFDVANRALEKQIAKKPKLIHSRYGDLYECPTCHTCRFREHIRDFCEICGQKLDWSEEKGGTEE
jgi:rRNA maturation endonuclease Nob1